GLQAAGFTPTELSTEAAISLDPEGQGFRISKSALTLRGKVPNIDDAGFARLAGEAEKNCPVSKVLNPTITLDATLTTEASAAVSVPPLPDADRPCRDRITPTSPCFGRSCLKTSHGNHSRRFRSALVLPFLSAIRVNRAPTWSGSRCRPEQS